MKPLILTPAYPSHPNQLPTWLTLPKAILLFLILSLELVAFRWSQQPSTALASLSSLSLIDTYQSRSWESRATGVEDVKPNQLRRKERVIIASSVGAHDDMYMSLISTLLPLLPSPSSLQIYSPGLRYELDTQVVEPLGIFNSSDYRSPDDLLVGVEGGWEQGRGADLVILGTCEINMERYSTELFKLWLARPKGDKFALVCIVHHAQRAWPQKWIGDWSRVGAISFMPISPHVSKSFRLSLDSFQSTHPSHTHLGLDRVPIHAYVLLLPLERLAS